MKRMCCNCKWYAEYEGVCCNGGAELKSGYVTHDFCCECHEWNFDAKRYAVEIVRDELLKHGSFYKGFLASINSAILESRIAEAGLRSGELSEMILNRIIGEENERMTGL